MKRFKKCNFCGKEFTTKRNFNFRKFCSILCAQKKMEKKIDKKCQFCNKAFVIHKYRENSARFCSMPCQQKFHKKFGLWDKAKEAKRREKIGYAFRLNPVKFWLGKKLAEETKRKMKERAIKGEDHVLWKGDNVGYSGLHSWVKRMLGTPKRCEFCGKDNLQGREIHWANIDHKYRRNLNNWLRLCIKCHAEYDKKLNLQPCHQ